MCQPFFWIMAKTSSGAMLSIKCIPDSWLGGRND